MNKIKLNSWGKFTNIEAVQHDFKDIPNLKKLLKTNHLSHQAILEVMEIVPSLTIL